MIFFYIEDNADSGVKIQKAVCIFTGFRNKGFGITYTYVAADGLQNAANRYSWVQISFQENMGNHGGGCGLPMCSGNGNGILIVFHQLSKQFCPGKHRYLTCNCFNQLRIITADSSSVNHTFNPIYNIAGLLSVKYAGTLVFQLLS